MELKRRGFKVRRITWRAIYTRPYSAEGEKAEEAGAGKPGTPVEWDDSVKVAKEEPVPEEEEAEKGADGAGGAEEAGEALTRTVMAGVEEPAHSVVAEEVGLDRCGSPRHRMPFNSISECSK
jgi:nucleoid-associated protein YgaU